MSARAARNLAALLGAVAFALVLLAAEAARGAEVPRRALAYRSLLIRAARVEDPRGLNAPVATYAAQVHQESRWDKDARSPVGAQGLSQFMPGTATWWAQLRPDLGKAAPWNPGWAARALVGYDIWLRERVRAHDECNRMALALAGYNGGLGWVRRDAALAQRQGLDPLTWWDNVETCNAGRSASAKRENQGYPDNILRKLEPLYEAAGWGLGVCP